MMLFRRIYLSALPIALGALFPVASALQSNVAQRETSRRAWLAQIAPASVAAAASLAIVGEGSVVPPAFADDLVYSTSASGIQWADSKVGSGPTKSNGEITAIDYVMSTTGARYGSKIYSTVDKNAPYRWKMGDGSTIQGLEEAILGGDGISPMKSGGIRRLVIPAALAYTTLAKPKSGRTINEECQSGVGIGPIPPKSDAFEEFQRFKNIYCNPDRQYQPDLVIDIKLYGKRS